MEKSYKVRKIVRGCAEGEAIVYDGSFSFLGDVDMGNGEIIAEGNPNKGMNVKDKILIYRETRGSSGGMVVLITLKKNGLAPAGIVTIKTVDYNLAEGAIMSQVPFACEPDGNLFEEIKTGDRVRLDADKGELIKLRITNYELRIGNASSYS